MEKYLRLTWNKFCGWFAGCGAGAGAAGAGAAGTAGAAAARAVGSASKDGIPCPATIEMDQGDKR